MPFELFDRQFFDILVLAVFGIGVIAAVIRLYQDFTRPLPPDPRSNSADADDTQPRPPKS